MGAALRGFRPYVEPGPGVTGTGRRESGHGQAITRRASVRLPAHATRRSRVLMTGAACLLAVIGLASPAVAAPQPGDKTVSAEKNAANQIAALQDIKKNLSPAEAKVDTQLVLQQRMSA